MKLEKIEYSNLNAKQKEIYNFQKVSSVLAEYGFTTIKLADDWNGADFIAYHFEKSISLKVQLKSRLTFQNKYSDNDIFICFPHGGDWYLYEHDKLRDVFLELRKDSMALSKSWIDNQHYTFNRLSKESKILLEEYKL